MENKDKVSFSVSKKCCCVVGCKVTYNDRSRKLYRFPGKWYERERKQIWINFASKKRVPGWQPKSHSKICSSHFIGNKKSSIAGSPSYNPTIYPEEYKKKDLGFPTRKEELFEKRRLQKLGIDLPPDIVTRGNPAFAAKDKNTFAIISPLKDEHIEEDPNDLKSTFIEKSSKRSLDFCCQTAIETFENDSDFVFYCCSGLNTGDIMTQVNTPLVGKPTDLFQFSVDECVGSSYTIDCSTEQFCEQVKQEINH